MTYIKTELGLTALKDRHAVALSRGQRSALILFDGIRSAGAVLAATGALGVSKADIDTLVSLGLLQAAPDSKPEPSRPPQDAPQTDFASSTLAAHYAAQCIEWQQPDAWRLDAQLQTWGERNGVPVVA